MAGPVYAAAVILPRGFYHPLLNDSKQVTEKNRDLLRAVIEKEAIAWHVASVGPAEIDRVNILKASFTAMHAAIAALTTVPELLLIDGHIFPPFFGIPHRCIVKGDTLYASIAAAAILAKTHRDEYMYRIHSEYPAYGWNENKGYGTAHHMEQIAALGLSPHHRRSFKADGWGKKR